MALTWPTGFRSGGMHAGIKEGTDLDVGVLAAESPVPWAGVFTRNAAAAAPVQWCRARLGRPVRALIVNSGNANACTGSQGNIATETSAHAVANRLGCAAEEVLVASTGPIGVQLPVEMITGAVPGLLQGLSDEVDSFARSILTTDTTTKTATATAGNSKLVGVAKGAAMLAPNMATMLAFIATDAALDQSVLRESLQSATDHSFNRVCIDACESTNDSVFVFGGTDPAKQVDPQLFAKALTDVCWNLAEQMVRDAEGATRLVRIHVRGAPDEAAGAELGSAVASSALWKAALHGGDPNWGRVLSALGAASRSLDLRAVKLWIGDAPVFIDGEPVADRSAAARAMSGSEIELTCVVGDAPTAVEVLTTDLSPEYVTLNAGGLS
ncbi:MAG: bifunctional glutamate N-acetyltransferase/amino-acid acetyltransferase ArgJ [Actinomycetota bacterium]